MPQARLSSPVQSTGLFKMDGERLQSHLFGQSAQKRLAVLFVILCAAWMHLSVLAGAVQAAAKSPGLPKQYQVPCQQVLLVFYNPWCGVCQKADPYVDSLKRELGSRASVRRLQIQTPEDMGFWKQWGVTGTPTFILFNHKGQAVYRQDGFGPPAEFRRDVLAKVNNQKPPVACNPHG
ncbi:MAG: thioredoxin domain-containing protein [Candidatus Melainabacteria bacterium]|nr:thioredoxin domain-containing protein [Candidatus Melainabacteria bacterium]